MPKRLIHLVLAFILTIIGLTGCYQQMPAENEVIGPLSLSQSVSWGDSSIWEAMSESFGLPSDTDQQTVSYEIQWWQQHQDYLYRILSDSQPYIYYIYQQTQNRGLPAELALVPAIESQYNPFAYSKVGAVGLWQMMPGTASGSRVPINWWYDGRRDLADSTKAALDYLTYLHEFFNNNWLLALAAYDSGAGTVENAIYYNKRHGRPTDFWDLPLPYETRTYVPKILALANIVGNPSYYGIRLPYVSNQPCLAKINLGPQMDISTAARLAGISSTTFRTLNPGYRRWATAPKGSNPVFIPIQNVHYFKNSSVHLSDKHRVSWQHYVVKSNDTLDKIASKYKTTPSLIQQINNLQNNTIHLHQNLLIPISDDKKLDKYNRENQETITEFKLPGPKEYIYTVKPEDTYWTISKTFDVSSKEIQFWNNLPLQSPLKAGQEIVIWTKKNVQLPEVEMITHTVKAGETLSQLAKKYHTYPARIKRLNHLANNTIRVGKSLKILYNLQPIVQHKSSHRKIAAY